MSSRHLMCTAVLAAAVATVGGGRVASADVSAGVIKEFHGNLVITKGDLPEGKNEKDTIAKIKAERMKELDGEEKGDAKFWHFHYTAFLTKTGASELEMKFFMNGEKFVASNQLQGIDPKTTVLSGDISISEDDGLVKGKPYVIKLVTSKNVVVASAPLVMK